MKYVYSEEYSSDKKKSIRRATKVQVLKLLMMNEKGNKCEICNKFYNTRSISFHHLHDKKFSINDYILTAKDSKFDINDYNILKKEVDKCVLLCHNCHHKLHELEVFNKDVLINSVLIIDELNKKHKEIKKINFLDILKMYNFEENDYDSDSDTTSTGFDKKKQSLKPNQTKTNRKIN